MLSRLYQVNTSCSHIRLLQGAGFGIYFTITFLLPIKNHRRISRLRKYDFPRQEFFDCLQTPAFVFRREHFHRLHSPFCHVREPQLLMRVSQLSCHSCYFNTFSLTQDQSYIWTTLPPPPTHFP